MKMPEQVAKNGVPEHPASSAPKGKGKGKGPYPRELPLPRSLPSGGENSTSRRCPPRDDKAGAFPFYAG